MFAEVVAAFAGTCVAQAMAAADDREQCLLAAQLFASSKLSSAQMQALVSMPWLGSSLASGSSQLFASSQHTTSSQLQAATLNRAKVDALLIQTACPVLGFPDLASSDFSSKLGSHGVIHKALQHPQASVQAAAAVLLPMTIANTARAAQTSSRGYAIVGIRLLQKGLDTLLSVLGTDSQSSKTSHAKVKAAAAFAMGSFVSMQHVIEHRLPALSLAVKHLLFLSPNKGSAQFGADAASDSNAASGACNGLLCWPPCPVDKLSDLPTISRGGAVIPDKVLHTLTKILMLGGAPAHQQVGYVTCFCLIPAQCLTSAE